jgi:hypothetical protein
MNLRAMLAMTVVVGCGAPARGSRPSDAAAPPTATAAATPAARCAPDDTADRGLAMLVAQGTVLADHIGPAAAAAIDADLAARPTVYLDRFACEYVDRDRGAALPSLLVAVPLWKLRAADPERVRLLATRLGHRLQALAQRPADPADPGLPARIAEVAHGLRLIAGGVDVAMAPSWTVVDASDVSACVTATLDAATVVQVSRSCSCGETLGCTATATPGGLALEVRFDPLSPAICSDCYPTTTACTVPALTPSATVAVTANGAALARWQTDTLGRPTAICR